MAIEPPNQWPREAILLCAGTDAACAARLAVQATTLLVPHPVVVLATWESPAAHGSVDAMMDALYDTHADVREAARRLAVRAAAAACDVLEAHGIDATPKVRAHDGPPWQTILDVAERLDCVAIVAGLNDERDPQPRALGRQARGLAHRSRRPLLLLPVDGASAAVVDDAPALFAYDGSPAAAHALAEAAQLLRPRDAIVGSAWQNVSSIVGVALAAIPDDVARMGAAGLDLAARLEAQDDADAGVALLAAAGWTADPDAIETHRNIPMALVTAAAEHDAAVVVTGTRGRSRIAAALLGSTAESIVRHAGRAVLLVPPVPDSGIAGEAA
jgi:nucleotide-binding universal stress UspA family protein